MGSHSSNILIWRGGRVMSMRYANVRSAMFDLRFHLLVCLTNLRSWTSFMQNFIQPLVLDIRPNFPWFSHSSKGPRTTMQGMGYRNVKNDGAAIRFGEAQSFFTCWRWSIFCAGEIFQTEREPRAQCRPTETPKKIMPRKFILSLCKALVESAIKV